MVMTQSTSPSLSVFVTLSFHLFLCVSHPLPGTQLLVYMKPMRGVRGISFKGKKMPTFADTAQIYQSKSP